MIIEMSPGKQLFAVIAYKTDIVKFVGVVKFDEIEAIGKNCPRLDLELQRDPVLVEVILIQISSTLNVLNETAQASRTVMKPIYDNSAPVMDLAAAQNYPHVLHVETGAVFENATSAARALNVTAPGAAKAVNRARWTPRVGRPATFHLVSTNKDVTHYPPPNSSGQLPAWRINNGYAEHNTAFDPQTGRKVKQQEQW